MAAIRLFDDDIASIPGCTPIDFPEPKLSKKTQDELKAIDDNIRAAHQMAPFIFLD